MELRKLILEVVQPAIEMRVDTLLEAYRFLPPREQANAIFADILGKGYRQQLIETSRSTLPTGKMDRILAALAKAEELSTAQTDKQADER